MDLPPRNSRADGGYLTNRSLPFVFLLADIWLFRLTSMSCSSKDPAFGNRRRCDAALAAKRY
jgi:hypothetical protein